MKPGKHAYPSVHRGIVRAAAYLLDDAFYTSQDIEILVAAAAMPDRKGDRLNGRGMHYYCAAKPDGSRCLPDEQGRYANGRGYFQPTPLTMFEGEWISAVTLYHAGKRTAALDCLSRAAHFLADICCPPHSCGLTYFSRFGKFHKLYEARAAAMFWGEAPVADEQPAAVRWAEQCVQIPLPQPDFFDAVSVFGALAAESALQVHTVLSGTLQQTDDSIRTQLQTAICHVAALLRCFADQTTAPTRCLRTDVPYIFPGGHSVRLIPTADGFYHLQCADGRFLSVSNWGKIRFGTDGTRFSLGVQGAGYVFHPKGDVWCALGEYRGALHCKRCVNAMILHERTD